MSGRRSGGWLMLCLGMVLLLVSCKGEQPFQQPPVIKDKIRIISTRQDLSALLYLAQEKDLFRKNGVDVEIIDGNSGVESADKLMDGEADIALMSDFAFVNMGFTSENGLILASIAEGDNTEIVARRDRGIKDPADLKGKIIGVKKGSGPDFFLGMYLTENSVALDEIQKVDLSADEFVEALTTGRVDALSAWPPHTLDAFTALDDNGLIWPIQGEQKKFWLMVGRKDRLPREETIRNVLTALLQAQSSLTASPDAFRAFLQSKHDLSESYMDRYYAKQTFRLSLSSDLLSSLEYQARWVLKQKNLDRHDLVPDYLEKIYFKGLDEVFPEGVSIIH